jgi:hypothetical protein
MYSSSIWESALPYLVRRPIELADRWLSTPIRVELFRPDGSPVRPEDGYRCVAIDDDALGGTVADNIRHDGRCVPI